MGLLIEGKWLDQWYDTVSTGGKFERSIAQFRNWITKDGSAGPTGKAGFKAETGRYHLYASYACPWVHRVLIYRKLKGLEKTIDVSFVHWYMAEQGWTFNKDKEGIVGDHLFDLEFAHQLYSMADENYTGRVTVPILWDKDQNTIVSNESSEIIRMLNSAFDDIGANYGDYYPAHLQDEIDKINHRIYHTVNNGVYKSGFSTTREAYKEAVYPLFETLNWLEDRLGNARFLHGNMPNESDWRLFPTLYRFDSIYHSHFKCSIKRIVDYPNLWEYTRDLYQWPGIIKTVNMKHARHHYYESHETINPTRIVPISPEIDWDKPSNRNKIF